MNEQRNDPDAQRASALAGELRVLLGQLKRRFRDQENLGDLTWSQVSVLRHLERDGPATVTTLARADGMRPQSMGAIVTVLEAAGLISGAPDPNDRRQTILSLTTACREKVAAIRAAREDWLFHAIQTNLAPAEQDQLAATLPLLKRLTGP